MRSTVWRTKMRMRNYIICEILCVLALTGFIWFLCTTRAGGTQKSIDEVSSPVETCLAQDQMIKKTHADAYQAFGIDVSDTEGLSYFANENVMDVSEMLIIKLKDKDDAKAYKEAIETRIEERKNLYKDYAPEQYALLCDSIVNISGNTVFYCTAKNADELYEAYKKAL